MFEHISNLSDLIVHVLRAAHVTQLCTFLYHRLIASSDPMLIIWQALLACFLIWVVFRFKRPKMKRPELTEAQFSARFRQFEEMQTLDHCVESKRLTDDFTILHHGSRGSEAPWDGVTRTVVKEEAPDMADHDPREVLDFYTNDFLRLARNAGLIDRCKETIQTYGVGSCGPRGFYGTIKVHLKLEETIGNFFVGMLHKLDAASGGTPRTFDKTTHGAIAYSYNYATVSSVISAFCKQNDHLVYDAGIGSACQTGVILSKSRHCRPFAHNNPEALEAAIVAVERADRSSKLVRKFIIIEGVYSDTRSICRLPEILAIAAKHRYRVIIDESFSVGVLGSTGRGVFEHFIDANESDKDPVFRPNMDFISQHVMITFGFGNSLGSIGGACFGTREAAEFQTLNGLGYCFSASAPPFLCAAAEYSVKALMLADESTSEAADPDADADDASFRLEDGVLTKLGDNAELLHTALLHTGLFTMFGSNPTGDSRVPLMIFRFATQPALIDSASFNTLDAMYIDVCRAMRDRGYLVGRQVYGELDQLSTASQIPGFRVTVSSGHTREEVTAMVQELSAVTRQVLKGTEFEV